MKLRGTSSFLAGGTLVLLGAIASGGWMPLAAVEIDTNGTVTYNTADPTDPPVSNWSTGWANGSVDGWDYVGQVGTDSGVYLGNGWVIAAAHEHIGNFTLDGGTYNLVAGSSVTLHGGTVDVTLFQISAPPTLLPSLTISASLPNVLSPVVMTGFGGGQGKTWGYNTVTETGVTVPIPPWTTTDFETDFGTTVAGGQSVTNNAIVVGGDSGGGDFVFNSATGKWELAGINEANDADNNSYMVQLNSYEASINAITGVPEPHDWTFMVLTGVILLMAARKIRFGE